MAFKWLGDLDEPDRDRFGSKSVNLALLARWGLPVPEGFAVAFEEGRTGILSAEERRVLTAAYAELAGRVGSSPLAVAVRSSAVGEDGRELSFAGQYETCLDVIGESELVRAVEGCLASQTSERAASYLEAAGERPAGMGILVQQMVRASFSGVCFTRSPLSDDEAVVEVVEGLGESLVSGERSPARVCFAREGLEIRSSEDPEGILEGLGREAARKVVELALEAEEGFGFPVDVEWALAAGEIWLLQSRPISAAARSSTAEEIRRDEIERLERMAREAGQVLAWSDFSLADMVPQPSPLGIEIFNLLTNRGGSIDRATRSFGLRYAGPEQAERTFEVICGRAFLNLGATVQSIDEALPLALDAKRLPASGERSVDVEHIPVRLAWRGWRSARRLPGALFRWLFVAPVRFLRLRRHFDREFREKVQPAVTAEAARLREQDLAGSEARSSRLRFVPGSSASSISATTTRSPTAFHSSAMSCCGGSSSACTSNRRMSSRRGSPPDCPATSTPRRISSSPASRRASSEWRSFWTATGTAAARTTRSRLLAGGRIRGGSRRWRRRSRGPESIPCSSSRSSRSSAPRPRRSSPRRSGSTSGCVPGAARS